MASSTD